MDLMVECGLTSSLISPLDSYYRKIKTNNPETMLALHFRNSKVKNWTHFDFLAFQKLNQTSFCQLKSPNVCDEIRNHRQGNHPKSINMIDVEFAPGLELFCDISTGKKSRPLVPHKHRLTILNMLHQLHHPSLALLHYFGS